MTGDFRGATFGPFADALKGMKRLRSQLGKTVYGVLGNHDTIRMVRGLEEKGIRILLNECEPIVRGGDNIEKAASDIHPDDFSILLSHIPEVYRQAAHAGFDPLLSGYTHGGQIVCLVLSQSHCRRSYRDGSDRGRGNIKI
jgi:uncharacterized protein